MSLTWAKVAMTVSIESLNFWSTSSWACGSRRNRAA
jgi:hypothetical protein